jgi:hypothetical protein
MAPRLIPQCVGSCFYGDLYTKGKPSTDDGRRAFDSWCSILTNPRIGRASQLSTQLLDDLRQLGADAFEEGWRALCDEFHAHPEKTRAKLDRAYGAAVVIGLERLDQLDRAKAWRN